MDTGGRCMMQDVGWLRMCDVAGGCRCGRRIVEWRSLFVLAQYDEKDHPASPSPLRSSSRTDDFILHLRTNFNDSTPFIMLNSSPHQGRHPTRRGLGDSTPIGLDDMPEEILHEITSYLLRPDQQQAIIESKQPIPSTCHSDDHYEIGGTLEGKDVISLSSCCKWMRTILFGSWLLSYLSIRLCEADLTMVEGLTKGMRDCVRILRIFPASEQDVSSTRQFSYIDFIRLFANIRHLDLRWTPFAEADVRLRGLQQAARNMSPTQPETTSALINAKIQTIHDPTYFVSDQSKVDQLGFLLTQMRFPLLRTFHLDFNKAVSFHTSDSSPLWSSFANALRSCRLPSLDSLWMNFGYMPMMGREMAVDFYDELSKAFQGCFCGSTLSSLNICIGFAGVPGDSYRFWSSTAANGHDGRPSPPWISPSSAMQRFIRSVTAFRPRLADLSLYTEVTIKVVDDDDALYGVGSCLLEYPVTSLSDGLTGEDEWEEGTAPFTTLLPMDATYAKLSIDQQHLHSMCSPILLGMQLGAAGDAIDPETDGSFDSASESESVYSAVGMMVQRG